MSEGPDKLSDMCAADGSRQFASLPDRFGNSGWLLMRDRLKEFPGVTVTTFVTDDITQAIADFNFGRHQFTVDTQFGELWLFVSDPACPDELLLQGGRPISENLRLD